MERPGQSPRNPVTANPEVILASAGKVRLSIPESKYGFVPAPASRSVAALLTHITVSPRMWFEVHGKQRVKRWSASIL
jgi:hypothetical protein